MLFRSDDMRFEFNRDPRGLDRERDFERDPRFYDRDRGPSLPHREDFNADRDHFERDRFRERERSRGSTRDKEIRLDPSQRLVTVEQAFSEPSTLPTGFIFNLNYFVFRCFLT